MFNWQKLLFFFRQVHCKDLLDVRRFTRLYKYISGSLLWYPITHVLESLCIPQALRTGSCTSRPWQQAGWPILFCRYAQEAALATANARETRKKFWREKKKTKKVWEWITKEELRKEEIPGSRGSMEGYILTYSGLSRGNSWAPGSQHMGP